MNITTTNISGGGSGGVGAGTTCSSSTTTSGPLISGKSITRLLQHSILQLCNEHIGYSHKLQILGVLCMTVDDEPQELVVKVNNTLKRVSPQQGSTAPPGKDPVTQLTPHSYQSSSASSALSSGSAGSAAGGAAAQHNGSSIGGGGAAAAGPEALPGPPPIALYNTAAGVGSAFSLSNPLVATGPGYATEAANEGEGSTTPLSPAASPGDNARKSHGRKRSKPVRVDHVYDEGGMVDESGGEILTVIPTDPDNPQENNTPVQPVYLDDDPSDDDVLEDEEDMDSVPPPPKKHSRSSPSSARAAKSGAVAPSTASPNVRALLQQSIARKGSSSSEPPASQLRSALLNTTPQCLTLPICVAPEEQQRQQPLANGAATPHYPEDEDEEDDEPGQLHIADDASKDTSRFGELDDSGVSVKEEPKDDYDWSRAGQVLDPALEELEASTPVLQQVNGTNFASPFTAYTIATGMEGAVSSLPTYSGLSLALSTANLQLATGSSSQASQPGASSSGEGGLSIRYTPTGPITVGANGKSVSHQKVKDIIMYDDQSPLSQQKGARLETDFMVDKMGMEGRKRRRRAPDETLTLEEIAEYMGASSGMDASLGQGTFQCKYCPTVVEELVAYLQHTLAVHNAYICHQCGKSFTTKSSLLRHRPIHTGMRRFACSICKKTFYRKDKCKAHIKRHLGGEGNNGHELVD